MPTLRIDSPGLAAYVQNTAGRRGYAHLGVPQSGAFDPDALHAANRAVGNPADAYGIECLSGGFVATALTDTVVAYTGTDAPFDVRRAATTRLGFASGPVGQSVWLNRGDTFRLGSPTRGIRTYLAVRGGLDVDDDCWSGCYDTLSHLGRQPLHPGDVLTTGPAPPLTDVFTTHHRTPNPILRFYPGMHQHLVAAACDPIVEQRWTVAADSNRIGVRLTTETPVGHAVSLPSTPTIPGVVQMPPDGTLVVFGPDAPTSGGYPIVGIVHVDDLAVLAQARPGAVVRFRRLSR